MIMIYLVRLSSTDAMYVIDNKAKGTQFHIVVGNVWNDARFVIRGQSSGIKRRVIRCVNRLFGSTCRFHLQGRKISQTRNQREAGSKKHLLNFNGLHGVISRKMEILINTAVITSNPIPHFVCLFVYSGMISVVLNQMWRNQRKIPSGMQRLTFRTSQERNWWTKQLK
jgi:hypothetical protein